MLHPQFMFSHAFLTIVNFNKILHRLVIVVETFTKKSFRDSWDIKTMLGELTSTTPVTKGKHQK